MKKIKVFGPVYLYIYGDKKSRAKSTEQIGKNVFADYDDNEELIGIEVLVDTELEVNEEDQIEL